VNLVYVWIAALYLKHEHEITLFTWAYLFCPLLYPILTVVFFYSHNNSMINICVICMTFS
jgi:hypothetical protein